MTRLSELYQDVILDHNRAPQNYRPMENANRRVEGNNPLCGDRLTVWLRMEDDVIADVTFQGLGCAISMASASLMTSAVKGKTRVEAEALFDRFLGVSDQGQMRQPLLACAKGCAGRSRYCSVDRIAR